MNKLLSVECMGFAVLSHTFYTQRRIATETISLARGVIPFIMENVHPDNNQENQPGQQNGQDPQQSSQQDTPKVRDSAYWYEQRHKEKERKQSAKNDDADPVDQEDRNTHYDDRLDRISDNFDRQERKSELRDYLEKNPEFKEFEGKIEKWWSDSSRRHLPVESIALEAVGKTNLERIYGERAKKADREVRSSQYAGGASARNISETKVTADQVNAMSPKELDEFIRKNGR